MTDIEKEMRIKELKSTIDVLRYECYVFNPLNLDRTALINKALDVAIRELKKVIVASDQKPCEDCISREDALSDKGLSEFRYYEDYAKMRNYLKSLPSVQPQPKTGKWVYGDHRCPCCGEDKFKDLDADIWADWFPKYCPNCGAKMERSK